MATISGDLKTKFTDDLGEPLVGGKVYTYHAGTSTPKDSYQDKTFAVVNTNPIILDDAGSCDLYLNGLYRLRVLDKDGVFVEERDYMTQGDSTGSSVADNANNITILQSEVQAINERSVLKLDENNFVIGHGSANSATVYDPAFRVDKLKIAKKDAAESAKLLFNTYGTGAKVEGETVKEGSYIDPDLITQPLVKNWQDVERAAFKGTKKDSRTNLLLKSGETVPSESAASRLIGATTGRVPSSDDVFEAYHHLGSSTLLPDLNDYYPTGQNYPIKSAKAGISINEAIANKPVNDTGTFEHISKNLFAVQHFYGSRSTNIMVRTKAYMGGNVWTPWGYYYTSNNTVKDSNGMIKASSPVLRVFSDHIEGNGDGENMGAEFVKKGVGDYLIKGTTGLRTDGWYITIPNDMNGNPKVAVTLTEEEGVVSLKSYKRIFDMNEFIFKPDLEQPLDIPDGRWVDLRFNDLPQEELDEPIE